MQGKPLELFKEANEIEKYLDLLESMNEDSASEGRSRKNSLSSSNTSRKSSVGSLKDLDGLKSETETLVKETDKPDIAKQMNLELTSRGTVKGSIFMNYLKSGGNMFFIFVIFLLFAFTQALASVSDFFVSFWTRQEEQRIFESRITNLTDSLAGNETDLAEDINAATASMRSTEETSLLSTEMCIYIQGTLVISIFVVGLIRSFSMYALCVKASENLHTRMFAGVIATKMRFFDTNPSGRIMNRFSKDLGAVDEWLAKAMLDAGQILLSLLGAIIVSVYVDYVFLIPIAGLTAAFMFVRKIFLKSSKNIKRLDGISKLINCYY